MSGDLWRGSIRRMQGLTHGPRTRRLRRENFDSFTPVVTAPTPPRRRYRSLNDIIHGEAAHQDAQGAGSGEENQGSEEQQVEDIGESVFQGQGWQEEVIFKGAQDEAGWQQEVGLKGAQDYGGWQDEIFFKAAQDHGWEEEEVGWQEQDAGFHQAAGDGDQSLDGFDPDVFLNLSDYGDE